MKKILGELTYEDIKDALKQILAKDNDINVKNNSISLSEKIKIFFQNLTQIFKGKEKEPLTKEIFIEKGKKFKAGFLELVDTVIFVVVAVIIIRYFIGEIRWIPSASMKPTLIEGDRVFIERLSRFYSSPKRGDIMVFYPPDVILKNDPISLFKRLTGFFCKDIAFIKRVIGTPGDKIEIVHNQDGSTDVLINDEPLNEKYIMDRFEYSVCNENMLCGPLILGEDEYFMMGDNRGYSFDSRYWGTLKKDRFIGKAVFLVRLTKI